jgi:hypothetical protein
MNPNDDQRLARYLAGRATTIDLPPGDPSSLVARASARRRRRRTVGSGLAAIALVAAAVSVQQLGSDDDGGSQVASEANAVVAATPLQWTTVVPNVGLAWSNSTAVTDDGTQFGLSTAPGRYQPDSPGQPQTLYRSTDGVEWSTVALPDDLWPSQIASSGNDLYAVGTSPAAGGGRDLVLAKSAAGGEWSTTSLPLDLAALDAQHPQLGVGSIDVSVGANGVVASVTLSAYPDPAPYLPAGTAVGGYSWTATGLDVYGVPEGCETNAEGVRECRDEPARKQPVIAASYTFDELGVDAALRSLIAGELHVFTSTDGATFEEAPLPEEAHGTASLVSTDAGFVLFATTWNDGTSHITTLRSADARSWTVVDSPPLQGWLVSTGTVDGRAALVVQTDANGASVVVEHADGTWSTIDLSAAIASLVPDAGTQFGVSAADVGPLGIGVTLSAYDDTATGLPQQFVAYSPDGSSLAIQPLADLPDSPVGYAGSVRVSADAVTVVFSDADPNDATPRSTLLVGTPR